MKVQNKIQLYLCGYTQVPALANSIPVAIDMRLEPL